MKLRDVLEGVNCEIIRRGSGDEVRSVVLDSRKIEEGALYICIRGFKANGHKFINDAAASGAAAILIDEEQPEYPDGVYIIKTADSRSAMGYVAANFYGRPAESFKLTGVTGTNGKTSTAHFIETIYTRAGIKTGLIGTIYAYIGREPIDIPFATSTTPDPIELQQIFAKMREKAADSVVMEVSSHALSLSKVDNIRFETAVFTNLTQDHLDFHSTMDAYRDAKAKLFGLCKTGVINADDEAAAYFMKKHNCRWLTYGIQNECDLKASHIEYLPDGSSFDVEIDGAPVHFFLPVKGRFNIYNALAAIGAALAAGIPAPVVRQGVADIKVVPGRMEQVPNARGLKIVVDYAHTPDGLINIINAVREYTDGRVITLFGCGGGRDTGKRPIMGRIAGELSDYCVITSDNPRMEEPEAIIKEIEAGIKETNCPYEVYANRREAIFAGIALLKPEDTLIIAGKGHERYQLIGGETLPFDDAAVAREALGADA